ncbi:DUF5050 domain-containing protein [Ruminococcaceae bacterium OttesenSCG-928-N02]|nr:DUF5050 domain-containing protein [Ruminococcaceae bacterium OttesenSCG-928-N02]
MSDIAEFEKQYKEQLNKAITSADMPAELLEQFEFDSCIRKNKDGKKELYLLTRKADQAKALLRITMNYPEEDAWEEGKILSPLNHPAIPKVYATYKEGERRFLVREYFEGVSLYDYMKSRPPMQPTEIYAFAEKICDILTYLHGQAPPVIHRDIKPQNIIVANDGSIKLIDFGIARLHKEGQEQDTSIILSAPYAPPEQYGYGQTTPATDIYYLGIVLLFLATKEVSKDDVPKTIRNRGLRRLIEKCVAYKPGDRYQSAGQIVKQVRKLKRGRWNYVIVLLSVVSVVLVLALLFHFILSQQGIESTSLHDTAPSSEPESSTLMPDSSIVSDAPNTSGPANDFIPAMPNEGGIHFTQDNYQGNLPGNINNGGFAVQGKDMVYFINNHQVFKMGNDGVDVEKIADLVDAAYLNYHNEMLYCAAGMGIYLINPGTGESTLLLNAKVSYLYIYENQLYFKNGDDNHYLYRMNLNGSDLEKLVEVRRMLSLNITNGYVYFTSELEDRNLFRCKLDGTELTRIYDREGEWPNVVGDDLIFLEQHLLRGIVSLNMNGGEPAMLSSTVGSYLVACSEGMVLVDNDNGDRITLMSYDGKNTYFLNDTLTAAVCVTRDWVFYQNRDDDKALWRVRLDGTENQKIV